jgi:hypothetical protein
MAWQWEPYEKSDSRYYDVYDGIVRAGRTGGVHTGGTTDRDQRSDPDGTVRYTPRDAGGWQAVHTLSRVWYARPDRLRVETVSPEPRRILVDGISIHKWVEGHAEGVRIPLAEASEAELLQVRKVPGTAEDYLLRLRGVPERVLPPTESFPVRRGYAAPDPHPFAELAVDHEGRPGEIGFFSSAEKTNRLMQVTFSAWREARPGIWFPCLQQATVAGPDGKTIRETVRVSALVVNEPLDESLFAVEPVAGGVRFVSVDEMVGILAERAKK